MHARQPKKKKKDSRKCQKVTGNLERATRAREYFLLRTLAWNGIKKIAKNEQRNTEERKHIKWQSMLEPVASRSLLQVDTPKGKFYFYRSFFSSPLFYFKCLFGSGECGAGEARKHLKNFRSFIKKTHILEFRSEWRIWLHFFYSPKQTEQSKAVAAWTLQRILNFSGSFSSGK